MDDITIVQEKVATETTKGTSSIKKSKVKAAKAKKENGLSSQYA